MSKHPLHNKIAKAGLDSLMKDPRYFDGNHPEHASLVDLVQRGFQMIFGGPEDRKGRNPRVTGPAPRPGLLEEFMPVSVQDRDHFEAAPTEERRKQGRGMMLAALKADGFPLPSGLRDEAGLTLKPTALLAGDTPRPLAAPGDLAQNTSREPLHHLTPPKRPGALSGEPGAQNTGQPKAQPGPSGTPTKPQPGPSGTPQKPQPGQNPLAVPSYRAQVFIGRGPEWVAMGKSAANATGNSKNRTRIQMEFFAAEGGFELNKASLAFGGITPRALKDIKKREPSLSGITRTDQLNTPELMAKAYRGYIKFATEKYGGPGELDKIKTPETAATVADTLFMQGTSDGAKFIKQGVIDAMNALPVSEWNKLGLKPLSDSTLAPDTMHNIQKLDAAGHGGLVRDKITDQRLQLKNPKGGQILSQGERNRIEHFRFAKP